MNVLITITLLISGLTQSAFADSCDVGLCNSTKVEVKTPVLKELERPLEWFSANDRSLLRSACKSSGPPPYEERLSEIKGQVEKTAKQNFKIHGVFFEQESWKLVQAFKELTTAMDDYGLKTDPSRQINLQEKFHLNPECKKVMCALEKIWGKSLGQKILYLKLKHHYNASEFAYPKSVRFDETLLDDVLSALSDLPEHLTPLGRPNQRLSLISNDFATTVYADSSIEFYNKWQTMTPGERQVTAFHELSHNISTRLKGMDQSSEWLRLSAWERKDLTTWSKKEDACFPSGYALETPLEDFAESLTAYRYSAAFFKKKCPQKYEFIKKRVFKGLEYDSAETCARISNSARDIFLSEMNLELNEAKLKKPTEEDILINCSDIMSPDEEDSSECYGRILKKNVLSLDGPKSEAALNKAGLKNNRMTKELMKERIVKSLLDSPEKVIRDQISLIRSSMQEAIERIARQGQPKELRLQVSFSVTCLKELLSKDLRSMRFCAANEILNNDLKYRTWGAGNAFPSILYPKPGSEETRRQIEARRDQLFLDSAKESTLLDQQIKEARLLLKKKIEGLFKNSLEQILKAKIDVKKMDPKDFCTTFYTEAYFSLPGFKSWCEENQARRKVRSPFDEKEKQRWLIDP